MKLESSTVGQSQNHILTWGDSQMSSERSGVMCFGWRCTKYTPALFQLFVTSHKLKNTKVRSSSRKRSWTSSQAAVRASPLPSDGSVPTGSDSAQCQSASQHSGQHRSNHSHCTLIDCFTHTHTISVTAGVTAPPAAVCLLTNTVVLAPPTSFQSVAGVTTGC